MSGGREYDEFYSEHSMSADGDSAVTDYTELLARLDEDGSRWRVGDAARAAAKIRSLYIQLDARATVGAQRESYISDLQAELKAECKAREEAEQLLKELDNPMSRGWRLRAEAAEQDAARYRWLRNLPRHRDLPDGAFYWSVARERGGHGQVFRGDSLDAAIDAAMKGT